MFTITVRDGKTITKLHKSTRRNVEQTIAFLKLSRHMHASEAILLLEDILQDDGRPQGPATGFKLSDEAREKLAESVAPA